MFVCIYTYIHIYDNILLNIYELYDAIQIRYVIITLTLMIIMEFRKKDIK